MKTLRSTPRGSAERNPEDNPTHLGLKPPLEHLLGGELKHEVEFLLLGVLGVQRQQLTGSLRGR